MLKPALNTGLDPDSYIVCSNFSYTQTEAEAVFLWSFWCFRPFTACVLPATTGLNCYFSCCSFWSFICGFSAGISICEVNPVKMWDTVYRCGRYKYVKMLQIPRWSRNPCLHPFTYTLMAADHKSAPLRGSSGCGEVECFCCFCSVIREMLYATSCINQLQHSGKQNKAHYLLICCNVLLRDCCEKPNHFQTVQKNTRKRCWWWLDIHSSPLIPIRASMDRRGSTKLPPHDTQRMCV